MAGKRLLDIAALANATRNVAQQHFRIRSQQFDAWSKTSSVAKAAKEQTERVTRTVQAADALARRFNEAPPQHAAPSTHAQGAPDSDHDPIPRSSTVNSKESDSTTREGLKQDHHYRRSEENSTSEAVPQDSLDVRQEKPTRYPTADGTIPPSDAPFDEKSPTSSDDITGQRHAESPRRDPLRDEQGRHVGEQEKPTEGIPKEDAGPEPEEVPGDIDTAVFQSPGVARKLGGRTMHARPKKELGPAGSGTSASENSKTKFADKDGGEDVHALASDIAKEAEAAPQPDAQTAVDDHVPTEHGGYQMRESRVPSSRFGRFWQYGGLATSMAFGAVGETFRRVTGTGDSGGSLMLSAGNMERLVAKLSRMRGAALKLGQMMSFQDSKMLPAPINEVLQRVQDNADYMPASQRDRVLSSNLGSDWRSLFSSFDEVPMAAASIGQVHKAVLASSDTPVAVKIQYPGVATSISSDLSNLSILLTASKLLPKGLFLDKTIANARHELAWECDYVREAACQTRFRELLADEASTFTVPAIIPEASASQVLTAELMHGTAVTKPSLGLTQAQRDWIGTHILRLCLRELTEFRFMQTDPNWTNFLFNPRTQKLELLDFGAARDYPAAFVDPYVRTLVAAATPDAATVAQLSEQLGYLTGHESRAMRDAHVRSVLTLAEPFRGDAPEVYDFRDQTVTERVRAEIPTMVRERLAPPPEETYSLHRKLSGAFLLLARLGSRVRCRELFVQAVARWEERQSAEEG